MSIKTDNMGAFGFAAVLALSRIFSETALLPGVYVEYGMQRFTAVVLSFLLAALLYVPLLVAAARNGGALLPDAAPGRRRMLSGFVEPTCFGESLRITFYDYPYVYERRPERPTSYQPKASPWV